MREHNLSICEKNFVQQNISQGSRLDGRIFDEARKLELAFGSEWGSCYVTLGSTKVLAQVSCEIIQPKQVRPNEGILYINVELGPMAGANYEIGKQTDTSVFLNRLLEKTFKDTQCVDLESLCIVVEEKVWSLRVDVKVLNHAGNLIECTSIATLAALAHFKRPDVTRSGDNIVIHSLTEKDPIATVLYHYPVCVTYGIFSNETLIADPNLLEEAVCLCNTEESMKTGGGGGLLIVGMNQYRELCLLDHSGAAIASPKLVYRATLAAALRVKYIVDQVKQAIVHDDNLRMQRAHINFSSVITTDHALALCKRELQICLKKFKSNGSDDVDMDLVQKLNIDDEETKYNVLLADDNTAVLVPNSQEENKPMIWADVSSESEKEE